MVMPPVVNRLIMYEELRTEAKNHIVKISVKHDFLPFYF